MRTRPLFAFVVAVSLVLAASCTQETHAVAGTTEIRPDQPPTTLVGRATVLADGRAIGALKTMRFEDGTGRTVTRVVDTRDKPLGFVTTDGRAYRHSAHGGTELVANSIDLRRNVAAVMGMPAAEIVIRDDLAPAPEIPAAAPGKPAESAEVPSK